MRAHLKDLSTVRCTFCDGFGHRVYQDKKGGLNGCPTRDRIYSYFGGNKNRAPHSVVAYCQKQVDEEEKYRAGYIFAEYADCNPIGQQRGLFNLDLFVSQLTNHILQADNKPPTRDIGALTRIATLEAEVTRLNRLLGRANEDAGQQRRQLDHFANELQHLRLENGDLQHSLGVSQTDLSHWVNKVVALCLGLEAAEALGGLQGLRDVRVWL